MPNRLGNTESSVAKAASAERDWAHMPSNAREVLGQLFLNGPLYDGHISSKVGRDTLVSYELIERGHGFQWLNRRGVQVALCADSKGWFDGRWHQKAGGA